MIHPSGVQRPEDLKLEIEEVTTGIFVIRNAYVGDYEYFPGQILIKDVGEMPNNTGSSEKTSNNSGD